MQTHTIIRTGLNDIQHFSLKESTTLLELFTCTYKCLEHFHFNRSFTMLYTLSKDTKQTQRISLIIRYFDAIQYPNNSIRKS